jgi:hypothetical protein
VLQEFRFRVQLYSQWDKKLAAQTRFFGAAALINTALADLCTRRMAPLVLSRATMDFLSRTGRSLETLNVALANHIHSCEIRADDLDHFMVLTEQNIVQRALQRMHEADTTRFVTVISQINRLLQFGAYAFCAHGRLDDKHSYLDAFADLRKELRRPVDFASKEDRVRLGCQLISHLRV